MNSKKLPISLEFFPPKTEEGAVKLRAVRQKLYALKPEFCSVTFGAGGSTQEGTLTAVLFLASCAIARVSRRSRDSTLCMVASPIRPDTNSTDMTDTAA